MKIADQTHERLVLWDRPILFLIMTICMTGSASYGAIVGPDDIGMATRIFLFVLAVGLIALMYTRIPIQRLVFDRQAGRIWRTRWQLGLRKEDYMDLSRLTAIHQRADRLGERTPSYYVAFEYTSEDGSIETERLSTTSTGHRHDRMIEILSEWLTRPDRRAA
ncbi:MAG: hypothetical protein AAF950_09850 [Pseudomonadota bacterium]